MISMLHQKNIIYADAVKHTQHVGSNVFNSLMEPDKTVSDEMRIKPIHMIGKMRKEYKNSKGDRK